MMIEVGFENDDVPVTVAPILIVNVTVPRFVAPSCSARVAVRFPPHIPATVKVNGLATAGPPGTRTPYVCGPLGARTPPPGSRVATRLVVLPVPMFRSGKLIVTVSSGSGAPLPGAQLSFVTVTGGAACNSGVPGTPQQANRWRAISSWKHPAAP